MRIESPYHEGELLVQERVGEVEQGRRNAAVISDSIMSGALHFIAQQPMAVVGSIDAEQNVWASILFGRSGFVQPLDDRTLELDLTHVHRDSADPFWANIERDPRIGVLVIELASRRRLRINGHIRRVDHEHLQLDVDEAYPNCPKYIQRRTVRSNGNGNRREGADPRAGRALSAEQRAMLAASDTFFVASANSRGGVDVSHRGGQPGFVRLLNDSTLRVPDYRGNSMYNTLGNFSVHPRAGLAFLDFDGGRILQLVGRPEIRWDIADPESETGGTGRYWDFHIDGWLESDLRESPRWEFLDASPHNPMRTPV